MAKQKTFENGKKKTRRVNPIYHLGAAKTRLVKSDKKMQKTSAERFFTSTEGKLKLPSNVARALSSVKNADFQGILID